MPCELIAKQSVACDSFTELNSTKLRENYGNVISVVLKSIFVG